MTPEQIAAKLTPACATCAYDMGPCWDDCTFPEPQDGSEPPLMAPASMPDRRNEGAQCHHYRLAALDNGAKP